MNQSFEILEEQLITAINLNDIKAYLRINYDYDDDFLKTLLTRAICYAEDFLRYNITCKKILFTSTNIKHNYKRLELPALYCKEVIEVKQFIQDEEIVINAKDYELTGDRTHLWVFIPNKITKLKITYKTEERLLINKSIQQSILTHVSDMYDHKENIGNLQNLYASYRRILI